MMNATENKMNKVELVSIEPTGTFVGGLELSKVTLKRGEQSVTEVMYWDNPELLGLEGTFEDIMEGDVDCDFEDC